MPAFLCVFNVANTSENPFYVKSLPAAPVWNILVVFVSVPSVALGHPLRLVLTQLQSEGVSGDSVTAVYPRLLGLCATASELIIKDKET